MYYQSLPGADPLLRATAVQIWGTMEVYEPPLFERLVALTYRVIGGEILWVSRIYSSLFWLSGGAALVALVRRLLSPHAALCSLAFYLILPWGVTASRAFQPDPWMVMWVLLSAYFLLRWMETGMRSWKWTVLAGGCSGLAILIKVYAGYPVAGIALGALLASLSGEKAPLKGLLSLLRRPQVWVYAAIALAIPAFYYLGLGERSSSFASFWIFSFSRMLLERKFYLQWLGLIRGLFDVMVFFAAVLGAFLFPARARPLLAGLWAGYILIGLTFPFQITTHDYYSLVLVPIAAISLAPYFDFALGRVLRQEGRLWKAAFVLVVLAIGGYYAWVARSQVVAGANPAEPVPWQIMGREIPPDGAIVGLTHDYGNRLKYYGWRAVQRVWPSQGDFDLSAAAGGERIGEFEPFFREQTEGMDFFLVTLFADLEAQPALKSKLYDHYPVLKQGDGYILFDLRHAK
jgi:4-amino-4-deoxy-L-arabinose transferase-like glycosyltransferase